MSWFGLYTKTTTTLEKRDKRPFFFSPFSHSHSLSHFIFIYSHYIYFSSCVYRSFLYSKCVNICVGFNRECFLFYYVKRLLLYHFVVSLHLLDHNEVTLFVFFFFYENIQSHWKTKTKINEKSFSLKSNIVLNRIYTHVYYILVLSLLRVVILSVTVSNHSQNIYTFVKKVFYFKVALDFRIDYILFDHIWLTIWVFFLLLCVSCSNVDVNCDYLILFFLFNSSKVSLINLNLNNSSLIK